MRPNATTQFQSFMRQADAALQSRTGLLYSDVQGDIESLPGALKLTDAMKTMTPDAFADQVRARFGLAPAANFADARQAKAHNNWVIAFAELAHANPEWKTGADGLAYRQEDAGVSRLRPVSEDGKTRIAAEFCAGAELARTDASMTAVTVLNGGAFEPVGRSMDIAEVVGALDAAIADKIEMAEDLEATSSMGM